MQSKGQPAGFSGHHVFILSRPAKEAGIIAGFSTFISTSKRSATSDVRGPAVVYLKYARSDGAVFIRTACSFLSTTKARQNLHAELPEVIDLTIFNEISTVAKTRWNKEFQRIHINETTNNHQNLTTFYTALWHSLLLPRQVNDADFEYLSFGEPPKTVKSTKTRLKGIIFYTYYDDFSMWDIFRAQLPLLLLLYSRERRDNVIYNMVASMVVKCLDGGYLPIFPAWNSYTDEMIGDHVGVLLAGGVYSGAIDVEDPLVQYAFECMARNALEASNHTDYLLGKGRRAMTSYLQHGFIPMEDAVLQSAHSNQQVSRTLEYAFDDYITGTFASFLYDHCLRTRRLLFSECLRYKVLNERLLKRSKNYQHVVDATGVGFIRPKSISGDWAISLNDFDPTKHYNWLTETTVWQYTWFIPHAIPEMIALYGGIDGFTRKLDEFFEGGWYNHGNEPDHHAVYLYAFTNIPWMMTTRIRDIMNYAYGAEPRSLSGNDDAGQVSQSTTLFLPLSRAFMLLVVVVYVLDVCVVCSQCSWHLSDLSKLRGELSIYSRNSFFQ